MSLGDVEQDTADFQAKERKSEYFDDERMAHYGDLLTTDSRAVLKAIEAGELSALRAIVKHQLTFEPTLPHDFYLQLFPICCAHASEENCRDLQTIQHLGFVGPYELKLHLATYSLWTIGSGGMAEAIRNRKDAFERLISDHWKDLYRAMAIVYEINIKVNDDVSMPRKNDFISAVLCSAMTVFAYCDAFVNQVDDPSPFYESAWTWWLYGGSPDFDSEVSGRLNWNNAASQCLSVLFFRFGNMESNLRAALKSSSAFGGICAIANIVLTTFHDLSGSKEAPAQHLEYHFIPFAILFCWSNDNEDEFLNVLDKEDGMAKLIGGLFYLAKYSRAVLLDSENRAFVAIVTSIIWRSIRKSHRHVEQAARNGILELFLALDPDRGDLPSEVADATRRLLDMVPLYFVYHSAIGSYSEAMRKLTEGNGAGDGCLAAGPFAESWRKMKLLLFERYCVKRFFDIIIADMYNYCNSCGKSEGKVKFLTCAKCRSVLYCCKSCQVTDWKKDGHKEDCGKDLYTSDIPFLCFLANSYLTTRSGALLQSYNKLAVPSPNMDYETAVFNVLFSFGAIRPLLRVTTIEEAKIERGRKLERTSEFVVRGDYVSPPSISKKEEKSPPWSAYIGTIVLDVFDGRDTIVTRYIALQPSFFLLVGCNQLDYGSAYFGSSEELRVAAVGENDNGKPITMFGADAIDVIYSQFYTPGEDTWTYHLREAPGGEKSNQLHILDLVDEYIVTKLSQAVKDVTAEELVNTYDKLRAIGHVLNSKRG